jgi:hypothetical protein
MLRNRLAFAIAAYVTLFGLIGNPHEEHGAKPGNIFTPYIRSFFPDRKKRRNIRRNVRGTYASSPPGILGRVSGLSVTVGPTGSSYPITSTVSAGGAAAVINSAISAVNALNGGTVWILGGPGTIYYTEATVTLLPTVNIVSDGTILKAITGATFSPMIGNATGTSLSALTYYNLTYNANSANSGFTAQTLSPTSTVAVTFPTLSPTNGTVVYSLASGSVSSVTINGRPDSTSGPWYVTFTDTVIFTFATATFTYTQAIDGMIVNQPQACTFIAITPIPGNASGTATTAGCAFMIDGQTSGVQIAGNYIDIVTPFSISGAWMAGARLSNVASIRAPGNHCERLIFNNIGFRAVDICYRWDDSTFGLIQALLKQPYGVGLWMGSGTSSTVAGSDPDDVFDLVHIYPSSGGNCSAVVLGYYQGSTGAKPSTCPALKIHDLRLDTTYSNFAYDVQDLRTPVSSGTGVYDFDITGSENNVKYRALSPRALLTGSSSTGTTLFKFTTPTGSDPPAAFTFLLCGWLNITTYSSGSIAFNVTYTDEQGTVHTTKAIALSAEASPQTLAATAGAAGFWYLNDIRIRCNPNTTVTVAFTNGSGSNVFDCEATCDWLPQ